MVREFQRADLDSVAAIWLDANLKAHSFIPGDYWRGNLDTVKELLTQAELYVCEHDAAHRIEGFIGLWEDVIAGLFVCEEAQSRGVGKQLLDHVKATRPELYLSVYEKNCRAIAFYQREGFAVQSRGTDEGTGEAEYVMVWMR